MSQAQPSVEWFELPAGPWPWLLPLLVGTGTVALLLRVGLWWLSLRLVARAPRACGRGLAITVLKPLRGLDEGLEHNLASLLLQDHDGPLQFVFGVTTADDPALAVVRRLQQRFPAREIAVVVGRGDAAHNPKVANLLGMLPHARHDVLLISDSNVCVAADYLRRIADDLAPEVALVANPVIGLRAQTLGAACENLQLGGVITGAVAAGAWLGHPCVIGKSMLVRRHALATLGGLQRFGDVLAEDYAIGQAMVRARLRVVTSPYVVATHVGAWTVGRFAARHLRWCQMRRWIAPWAYLGEPLLLPSCWWLAVAWLCLGAGGGAGWSMLAVAGVLAACGVEAACGRVLRGGWQLREAAVTPYKDAIMLGLWALAWVRRDVAWRGHHYRIGPGSVLTPVGARPVPLPCDRASEPLAPLSAAAGSIGGAAR
ncbi:MAG: glycosyltransferase [Nannocystaceae bacterium]|nr:glycosyltransferase [Nannocystaceae bacterium]